MADDNNATPQGTPTPTPSSDPAPSPAPSQPTGEKVLTFTQAEFDAKMAAHKRGLQRELAAAREQAANAGELKSQVQQLLDLGIVPDGSNLDDLSTALDGLLTDKERYERDAAAKASELEAASAKASEFETLFRNSTREQALSAAMNGRVVNDGAAELVQLLLKDKAVYGDDHSVTFKMSVKGEDGKVTEQQLSATEALNALEAMPSKYGTLFKSTVNAGPGGTLPDGTPKNSDGTIDMSSMTYEQFADLADNNPKALAAHVAKMK